MASTLLRRYFVAGMLTLLPMAITLYVAFRLFVFLDGLLGPAVFAVSGYHIPGAGLVATLAIVTLTGAVVSNFLGRHLIVWIDLAFQRTPVLKSIYDASKQLVTTVFDRQAAGFKTVVLVPYPSGTEAQTLGFLVSELAIADPPRASVFVPMSPPTGGFIILVDPARLVRTRLSPEEAMRMLLLGGGAGRTRNGQGA
ncbi:MAG TPA: DUF502 domain-containing protein [Bacillota bacterium]|nr:DUF502 domain-containing protein [Bacillota bacterium]